MAAIAEETEQERLAREEQEAALAEMQQLLDSRIAPPDSQLPQEAIPAENVGFTNGANGQIQIDTPEGFSPPLNRQMIGDAQYQNELARAQRGNGFLNADVGPAGNTIVGGYDPSVAEAAQRRQQAKLAAQAKRFNGVQKYQSLLQNGATREEALALAGSDMFFQDPEALRTEILRPQRIVRPPPLQKFQGGKVTPALRAQEQNISDNLRERRKVLTRGTSSDGPLAMPLTDEEKSALKAEIQGLEKSRVDVMSGPESNPNVDQIGWGQMREAWNRPAIVSPKAAPSKQADKGEAVSADSIREQFKSGKLSREEAKKALHQLGFD